MKNKITEYKSGWCIRNPLTIQRKRNETKKTTKNISHFLLENRQKNLVLRQFNTYFVTLSGTYITHSLFSFNTGKLNSQINI